LLVALLPCLAALLRLLKKITTIGSIWEARCGKDQGTLRHVSLARFAVLTAVRYITEAMQRDWLCTSTDIRMER
jgi:hypothetical protein